MHHIERHGCRWCRSNVLTANDDLVFARLNRDVRPVHEYATALVAYEASGRVLGAHERTHSTVGALMWATSVIAGWLLLAVAFVPFLLLPHADKAASKKNGANVAKRLMDEVIN